jgi:hypothetical protein
MSVNMGTEAAVSTEELESRRADRQQSNVDFSLLMPQVAQALLGPPNRRLSVGNELRWGTRGSFSVKIREGVWYDNETKTGGGVLDLIMREKNLSSHAEAAQWLEDNHFITGSRKPKRRVVATFDYVDEAGAVQYQTVKYEPKGFNQRRSDGNGGWVEKPGCMKGVRPLPYRLPELKKDAAAGREIYILEGEKCVDAARAAGLAATCNHGGAGNWRTELNAHLLGADVVVVADNDDAGRKHVRDVATKLVNTAKRIRLLDLGEVWKKCPPKGDTYDYLQGHKREELEALAAAAPEYDMSDTPAAAFTLEDFRAYMPTHQYIFIPTCEMWTAASVNSRLPMPAPKVTPSAWLDQHKPAEQMAWAPGMPTIISDKVVADGGWVDHRGVTVFNLYRPPTIVHGDAAKAGPWLDHVRKVYPADADHVINYLAHRVQRPQEKINHGLVLGGPPGVGKDTLIEPVKRAVGPWNVQEVSPQQVLGRFNGFVKAVILRISEARDLGELNRFAFYEHLKIYLAAPPEVIRCDEKNLREHSVLNVMGVIITSNRKDSFFLPADDRRHYVAWTDLTPEDFTEAYWQEIWNWYEEGGDQHVAAYLAALDISHFKPKAPPPKTSTFWEIVETNRTPENSELADALDALGNPNAVTLDMIRRETVGNICDWISDRKNARQIPHRMSECGYVPVRNEAAKDGLWRISDKRQVVYAKAELSVRERHEAVWAMAATQQQGL